MRCLWRYYIAAAAVSICFASIATCLFLNLCYDVSRPRQPEQERGFVYPVTDNGYTHYISGEDSARQVLLFGAAMITMFVVLVAMPRELFRPPNLLPGESRHAARVKAWAFRDRAMNDLLRSNPSIATVCFITLVIYVAIIYFIGPSMARLAASYGLTFN